MSGGPATEDGAATAHAGGAARVLVVDDDPVNLMLIAAQLEFRGLVPVLAADGAEAVALVREMHFDLVLMDLQMPVLGGLEATSVIRRFERTSPRPAVPVVAHSCTSAEAGVLAMHGMNGSLSKPCADQELEDCLVRWCPSYRRVSQDRAAARELNGWHATHRAAGPAAAARR
jgi:CheY-like chemotaxis protein